MIRKDRIQSQSAHARIDVSQRSASLHRPPPPTTTTLPAQSIRNTPNAHQLIPNTPTATHPPKPNLKPQLTLLPSPPPLRLFSGTPPRLFSDVTESFEDPDMSTCQRKGVGLVGEGEGGRNVAGSPDYIEISDSDTEGDQSSPQPHQPSSLTHPVPTLTYRRLLSVSSASPSPPPKRSSGTTIRIFSSSPASPSPAPRRSECGGSMFGYDRVSVERRAPSPEDLHRSVKEADRCGEVEIISDGSEDGRRDMFRREEESRTERGGGASRKDDSDDDGWGDVSRGRVRRCLGGKSRRIYSPERVRFRCWFLCESKSDDRCLTNNDLCRISVAMITITTAIHGTSATTI